MSIRDVIKKRGRPATGRGLPVTVRLQPDLLDAVDQSLAGVPDAQTRPEMVRYILRDWLVGHGYLPHREDPEGVD